MSRILNRQWARHFAHISSNGSAYLVISIVVIARSAIFVFWEHSSFNSNQGVFGLMAKHLIEGRAFPVFMYGQNYMLAVESWLAAPFFLAGTSVAALKLPLLAMNVAAAVLLVRFLTKDGVLAPLWASVATLFFVLPSPGTSAKLVEASGGIVEPFVYVLLLWAMRGRPLWFGLILGVAASHREFAIYGFVSVLILDAVSGTLFTRRYVAQTALALMLATSVWFTFQRAALYSSAMGPGTAYADLPDDEGQTIELAQRFCFDWATLPDGAKKMATVHWPLLFGTEPEPLAAFAIESHVRQGMPGLSLILAAAMLLAIVRTASQTQFKRRWLQDYQFCAYLVLVGVLSASAYAFGRCGLVDLARMRYDMLSLLGAVGIAGWFLRVERSNVWRGVWLALVLSWMVVTAGRTGVYGWSICVIPRREDGRRSSRSWTSAESGTPSHSTGMLMPSRS